jgi:hypothetical protein
MVFLIILIFIIFKKMFFRIFLNFQILPLAHRLGYLRRIGKCTMGKSITCHASTHALQVISCQWRGTRSAHVM